MKKIILTLLSIVLIFTGCDTVDFGDTNDNVNGPTDPNTATLLSGAMTNFSTRTGRPYRITPTLYVQYFMQHVYNEEMLYADAPGYWSSYYVQVLSNLNEVINIVSDETNASDPVIINNGALVNQQAVAMIFKSIVFKRVTDLFGDAPYSQALTIETLTPAYDSQEDIYAGMIADVKAARDMINTSAAGPTGDAIYGGNMAQWQKFANSFLMALSLQLSEVSSSKVDAQAVFVEALGHSAGVIDNIADDALYTFDVQNGFDNPWSWMRPADYGITRELVSSMKGAGLNKVTTNTTYDNRFNLITNDPTAEGHPYGYLNNVEGANSPVGDVVIDAGTQLPLLTAAYTYLNRAEAAAKGWTSEDVNAMLTAGIQASYSSFSYLYEAGAGTIGDGAAYAAARVADIATAPGGAEQVIGEEKWIALFPLGFDSWSEWRRTGYPILTPATDAKNDGNIPTRYNYPSDEVTLNAAGYSAGVGALSPAQDINTAKVWWDAN